jgi:hypothetical protein
LPSHEAVFRKKVPFKYFDTGKLQMVL